MKKVLAILGSPRRWGNAELLLEEFLKEFKKKRFTVKKIIVSELNIKPCTNCGRCAKTGRCVIRDDMDKVYEELKDANCLVIASPIYFTSLPGQLKILIDRCQVFWARFFVLKKPVKFKDKRYGVFLSVCGYRLPRMFNCAIVMVKILFKVLNFEFYGKVVVPNIDKKGDILKETKMLSKTRKLAKKLIKEIE
ncbi:MAG: hypothetical protein COS99_04030 [Candidatus Omnitrophica bacterium CG07_land_8_20_14_0_80_42_15]|uniref:NADPH-dependent FMN reductase-like domain-containing protein n=1 Tax=Candidatus Aquitaenariimonas noxiae TaxID=1974741 RepID=A0A2J0L5D0_9BACT|nr:MAG: hypothetical protein COS99_04030 [Candidatus Omnitrophica bacterium CG07_land_8_20_14_0_80_42_15]